jgi:hypothetical protein
MQSVLLAWIGNTDLKAPLESASVGLGPIAQSLDARRFDAAFLLTNHTAAQVTPFVKWLSTRTTTRLHPLHEKLTGPTHFGEIYEAAVRACVRAKEDTSGTSAPAMTFHLSPGTPAMAAIWIILAKTRFPAELIESSKDHGVRTASVPFDLSADFVPDLLRATDERLRAASGAAPPPRSSPTSSTVAPLCSA